MHTHIIKYISDSLEIDSPSRGRKRSSPTLSSLADTGLEIDSPSRGRKREFLVGILDFTKSLEIDSPSRGRKLCAYRKFSIKQV